VAERVGISNLEGEKGARGPGEWDLGILPLWATGERGKEPNLIPSFGGRRASLR